MIEKPPPDRPLTALQQRGKQIVDHLRGTQTTVGRGRAPDPRVGIALGGGSARGLTHIPYIEALDELGITPSVIAGCSIGALIGSGWASGMTGKELREHSFTVLATMRVIAGRIWAGHMSGRLGALFTNGLPISLNAVNVVDSFLPDGFVQEFKDLKVPFYVVAADLQSWHQVVFSEGPLREAIAGSISIPSLFKPVTYANHILIDGGVVNPLPLDQADPDSDILIGVDVNGDPSEGLNRTDYRALDVWFGAAQIMMHQLIANAIAAYPPDIYVRPHLEKFGALEFWRVKEVIAAAEKDKDRFKRQVTEKVEAFIAEKQRTIATESPIVQPAARK
jgi:NTE family protein